MFLPLATSHSLIGFSISATGGQGLAVRAERYGHDNLDVSIESGSLLWLATSHNVIVCVKAPEAKVLPSGLNATEIDIVGMSLESGGVSYRWLRPTARIDLFMLPEARVLPSRTERHGHDILSMALGRVSRNLSSWADSGEIGHQSHTC